MARMWDMWIDGVPFRDPDGRWGIDGFEGAHQIPQRKDALLSPEFFSGASVIYGPYEVMSFTLSGWAAGTREEAEYAVSNILARWGGVKPVRLAWKGAGGQNRNGEVRIIAGNATLESPGLYRVTLAAENLWGVWYGDQRTVEGRINAGLVSIGNPTDYPSFRAHIDVYGKVKNPVVTIGDDVIGYAATIPSGPYMRFVASPAGATAGGVDYLHRCNYDPLRGVMFACRGAVSVTGEDLDSNARWVLRYNPVLV